MNFSLIYQSDSIYVIIMAVHHRALNVKFVIICHCKIYFCHSCKNSHQYNRASFSCIFNCLSHCDIVSGTVVDHIRLIRSKCFDHCLTEVFIFGIHTHINSTFFCLCQSKITDICDHHFRCPHSFCCLCHEISNWSCSKDCNIHASHIAHLFYTMNCHSKRFDHSSFFIGHIFWNRCYFRCIHCKILRCCSCRLKSHYF